MNKIYDFCIVGGGITGFYTAYKLIKRYPKASIILLESSSRYGGRINTIKFKDNDGKTIQYEAGGARFNNKHKRLIKLLKQLDLYKSKIPITSNIKFEVSDKERCKYQNYILEFKTFDDIIKLINKVIADKGIPDIYLRSNTIINLCKKYLDKLYSTTKYNYKLSDFVLNYFPYWSELYVMNAYDALYIFTKEFKSNIQYYILKNGYSEIITKLKNKCNIHSNFDCRLNSNVTTINLDSNINSFTIVTNNYNSPQKYIDKDEKDSNKKDINEKDNIYECKHIIFTIPMDKLVNITLTCTTNNQIDKGLKINKSILKKLVSEHLTQQPLYRIYARYPNYHYELIKKKTYDCNNNTSITTNNNTSITTNIVTNNNTSITKIRKKIDEVWFKNIGKLAIPGNLKYIIPVDKKNGLIMISYTDGKNAKSMITNLNKNPNYIEEQLNKSLGHLNIEIPKPLWIKHYYWYNGASYWKPTTVSNLKDIERNNIHASKFSKYIGNKIANFYNTFTHNKIYCLNENISIHQAWIEGGLQTVDDYLGYINIKHIKVSRTLKINSNGGGTKKQTYKKTQVKKNNKITIKEVNKHNKKTDAWIVINKNVYDITNWIPNHPGGNIIMKGVGKDATVLFKSIHNHSDIAKSILSKYKIGKLVN